jgi:hypothetical protein
MKDLSAFQLRYPRGRIIINQRYDKLLCRVADHCPNFRYIHHMYPDHIFLR